MSILRIISNIDNDRSISSIMRRRRMQFFRSLLDRRPIRRILDIGGTYEFWIRNMPDYKNYEIVLLNLFEQNVEDSNFISVTGDATNLSMYQDDSFDLVFSNSVIEHLFTRDKQLAMANEVKRVGKAYFIQTPNRYFPIEPHFLFPLFQFLPFQVQLTLLKNFSLGHVGRIKQEDKAIEQINEIRLLSRKEFVSLFGRESLLFEEKFCGMTKSFTVYKV